MRRLKIIDGLKRVGYKNGQKNGHGAETAGGNNGVESATNNGWDDEHTRISEHGHLLLKIYCIFYV